MSNEQLIDIVDPYTEDTDCRSIQTILTHVVRSGYGYAIVIKKHLGEDIEYAERQLLGTVSEYQIALKKMFTFNEQFFKDHPLIELEEYDGKKKNKSGLGTSIRRGTIIRARHCAHLTTSQTN